VLRQITSDVAGAEVHLFKPAEAIILPPNTDDGTPTQKDEPQAENPPSGAVIDYYLKSSTNGPVTIEILDAAGGVVRRYSSDDPRASLNLDQLQVNAVWVRPPDPPSTTGGMHRWVWDLRHTPVPGAGRGGRGGGGVGGGGFGRGNAGALAAPGSYTVKLTVNGTSYSQPLIVKPDPRDVR
jgi:hypothetical protein